MMYIHHMIRTQLYLDESMHARLRRLARRQGRSLSDLVRDALRRVYGDEATDRRLASLRGIEGLWQDREDLGATEEYVRRMRRDTRPTRP